MASAARITYFDSEVEAKEYAALMLGPGEVVNYFQVTEALEVGQYIDGVSAVTFRENGPLFVVIAINIG